MQNVLNLRLMRTIETIRVMHSGVKMQEISMKLNKNTPQNFVNMAQNLTIVPYKNKGININIIV